MKNGIKGEFQGIKFFKDLSSAKFRLDDFKEGENIYVQDEGIFTKVNGILEKVEGNIGIKMTQYDINKNIYSQMAIPEELKIKELAKVIDEYETIDPTARKMLLCRELNYYTIFESYTHADVEFETLKDAVIACAQDIGNILDIQLVDGAVEIWIKIYETNEPVAMYLFNCEQVFVGYRG